RDHALTVAWIADRDRPRPPATVAQHMAVAAGGHHRVRYAQALEDPDAVVDHVALGEAAEIDAHAFAREADRACARVQLQVSPADAGARALQRSGVGHDALTV